MSNPWKSKGGRRQTIILLTGTGGAAALKIEASPDGLNWNTVSFFKDGAAVTGYPNSVITDTPGASIVVFYQIQFGWYPYLRINVTSNTATILTNAWLTEDGLATQGTLTETVITGNNSDQ